MPQMCIRNATNFKYVSHYRLLHIFESPHLLNDRAVCLNPAPCSCIGYNYALTTDHNNILFETKAYMDSFEVHTSALTFILLMWRIGRAPNSTPIYSYIQQDATSHSLFISGNCSACLGWYCHTSSGAHTTLSTASGICHTVTAICRYRGRVGTGLSVPWVAYANTSTPPTAHSNLFQLFHDSGR
jgi:hypothetical protein